MLAWLLLDRMILTGRWVFAPIGLFVDGVFLPVHAWRGPVSSRVLARSIFLGVQPVARPGTSRRFRFLLPRRRSLEFSDGLDFDVVVA